MSVPEDQASVLLTSIDRSTVVVDKPAGVLLVTDDNLVVLLEVPPPAPALLATTQRSLVLVDQEKSPGLVVAGFRGDQGKQGVPGTSGNSTFSVIAGAELTWPCVVAIANGVAHYADPTNVNDMVAQLAITTQAAASNQPIAVATGSYQVTEENWSWTPGRVYLALKPGQLTQTYDPSIGAILEVGRAISPTTIEFAIQVATLR